MATYSDGTPNTQRLAIESKADILGLSGVAGWGKTDTALGIAKLYHTKSVLFRRLSPNLKAVIRRSKQIYNPNGNHPSGFISKPPTWNFLDNTDQQLEFAYCQYEDDKNNQKGNDRDLFIFDEVTEFTLSIVMFCLGWMRSPKKGQRCRAILTFNPPEDDEGRWVIEFFLPWIAYLFPTNFSHPNPAKPGELRWYTTLDNGDRIESESGAPFEHDGKIYEPISRSFLFGTLEDNPHIRDTNYQAILSSMPEPERSRLLLGNFAANIKSNPKQIIPTKWVKLAQARWLEREQPKMALSGVGIDAVYGGRDDFTVSKRYGNYFTKVLKRAGVDLQNGPESAKVVYDYLVDDEDIGYMNVDIVGVGCHTGRLTPAKR